MCYSINVTEVDEIKDYMVWFPTTTQHLTKALKDLIVSLDQRSKIVPKNDPVIHLSKEEYADVIRIKNIFNIH